VDKVPVFDVCLCGAREKKKARGKKNLDMKEGDEKQRRS
jgi:hypothetical protein